MVGVLFLVLVAATVAIVVHLRRKRRLDLPKPHRAVVIDEIVRRECANLDREYERLLNHG